MNTWQTISLLTLLLACLAYCCVEVCMAPHNRPKAEDYSPSKYDGDGMAGMVAYLNANMRYDEKQMVLIRLKWAIVALVVLNILMAVTHLVR